MSILLDTHVWVWWLTASPRLSLHAREALNDSARRRDLSVSAISLWEVQVLHAKRRLELDILFADWLVRATDERVVTVVPIDVEIVLAVDALPHRFHGDPADRLIVATARARRLRLATHDKNIRRSRTTALWSA